MSTKPACQIVLATVGPLVSFPPTDFKSGNLGDHMLESSQPNGLGVCNHGNLSRTRAEHHLILCVHFLVVFETFLIVDEPESGSLTLFSNPFHQITWFSRVMVGSYHAESLKERWILKLGHWWGIFYRYRSGFNFFLSKPLLAKYNHRLTADTFQCWRLQSPLSFWNIFLREHIKKLCV